MTESLMSGSVPMYRLPNSALAPSVAGSLEAYNPAPAVGPAHCSVRNRAASPSCMDTQGWVRAPTRTHQWVIPRWCLGARPKLHVSRVYLAGIT